MRTDLVTGATGFIGRHLAARLVREGRKVRLLCRAESVSKLAPDLASQVEVTLGDLRDARSLAQAVDGVARVFHCAGQVSDWGAERDFVDGNVRGTAWLLEQAEKAGASRFVHMSSIAVFGTPSPPYFDDDSPYGAGTDPYTRTKIAGEQLALAASLPTVVLRPAVVYGPDGTWLEYPLRMIESGKMFLLGGGEGTCHPCYVENLVDAALLVANDGRAIGKAYIVADDDPVTFREYFNALARIAGKDEVRRSIPLPAARAVAALLETVARATRASRRPLLTRTAIRMVTTRSRMSIRRIREDLGYEPRYRFREAIDELTAWYRERSRTIARVSHV
jgi:nucleoside-diphosphate-sugar epimerase